MLISNAITFDKLAPAPSDPVAIERLKEGEEHFRRALEKWQEYFETHKTEQPVCSVNLD